MSPASTWPGWRRAAARPMLEVAGVMVALILSAARRARDELVTTRPLTWMCGAGLVLVLSAVLAWRARSGARSDEAPSPR